MWSSMYQSVKIIEDRNPEASAIPADAGSMHAAMRFTLLKVSVITLIGAALAFPMAASVPQKFEAETRLKIEAASERAINDAAAALHSKRSLDNLIRALNLGGGSEFAVDRSSLLSVASDIVSGEAMTVSQAENRLRDRLSQAILTSYDRQAGELTVSVTAAEADEAVKIANMLGDTLSDEIAISGNGASEPLVEKLRQTLEHAEASLSGFIAKTDQQKLAQLRRAESEEQQLTAEISGAEAQLAELKQKAVQASEMKFDDILSKPLPDSLEYTGLDYQRQRYIEAKLAVDRLAGDLGPRHPRLLAARAALEDARSGIQTALKQLSASLGQQEKAAAIHLAELKAAKSRKPGDKEIVDSAARLAGLEAAVGEARRNYLDALQRGETHPKTAAAKVEVLVPATVERVKARGLSVAEISGAGALAGFCLGSMLVFFTRRKPGEVPVDGAEAELATEPELTVGPDWREDVPEPENAFEELHDPRCDDPFHEPKHPRRPHYPAPANDRPLVDHIREVLMVNRRLAQEADLPPLVSPITSARLAEEASHARPLVSQQDIRRAEEVRELRRHMTELRERVQMHSARRSASAR